MGCAEYTNMWRTSGDIRPSWESVMNNLDTLQGRGKFAKPGSWNDPDFLEIDNGHFKYDGSQKKLDENQAHFSMWAITSAPLILGNDVTNMHADIIKIVTNKQAIAINQGYAANEKYPGNAGDIIFKSNNAQIWYKPLPNNVAGVALFNRAGNVTQNVTLNLIDLPALAGKQLVVAVMYGMDYVNFVILNM